MVGPFTLATKRRNRRQDKRERMLKKLAAWRAAKARKRQRIEAGLIEPEVKLVRWYPLEVGFRDKATGETAWTDFRGVRDVMRRASVIQRLYEPAYGKQPFRTLH